MGLLVALLIVAALVVGGLSLLIEGLLSLLVIGVVLLIAGILVGFFQRGVSAGRS